MTADTVPADVSDTSIRVSHETADDLFELKNRGESYEDVIRRLIEERENDRD